MSKSRNDKFRTCQLNSLLSILFESLRTEQNPNDISHVRTSGWNVKHPLPLLHKHSFVHQPPITLVPFRPCPSIIIRPAVRQPYPPSLHPSIHLLYVLTLLSFQIIIISLQQKRVIIIVNIGIILLRAGWYN